MGIYEPRVPKTIKVYKDGELVEEAELLSLNTDKYTDECGFLGIFSSFCSVNMTTSWYEKIITLNQIKEYQREEREFGPTYGIRIGESSSDNEKKRTRGCILM